jgi:hypothetical protein
MGAHGIIEMTILPFQIPVYHTFCFVFPLLFRHILSSLFLIHTFFLKKGPGYKAQPLQSAFIDASVPDRTTGRLFFS